MSLQQWRELGSRFQMHSVGGEHRSCSWIVGSMELREIEESELATRLLTLSISEFCVLSEAKKAKEEMCLVVGICEGSPGKQKP